MTGKQRWGVVGLFAAAMAWVESAVVYYLRVLIGRVLPYQFDPLPVSVGLGKIELAREVATLVMLLAVGWMAGRTQRSRLGYAMLAFGLWDILYYVFLIPMSGWPRSLLDWDILFLIPLPWWGPVLAPVLIAALMVILGVLISYFDESEQPVWPGRLAWGLNFAGVALALYVFMADAIRAAGGGVEAVRTVLPVWFNWPLFTVALALLAAPIVDVGRQIWRRHSKQPLPQVKEPTGA
jgi:hypothetical protein